MQLHEEKLPPGISRSQKSGCLESAEDHSLLAVQVLAEREMRTAVAREVRRHSLLDLSIPFLSSFFLRMQASSL